MRYNDANTYFKLRFGHKMYKAAISLDVTCPNRDGSKGIGGCAFCSAGGSGEFASDKKESVTKQIDEAVEKLSSKVPADTGYIAYFQSFTGTYCSPSYLRESLEEATSHPLVEALALATRPDCLPPEILEVLKEISSKIPLMVELGLQTSNDETAQSFQRGYKTSEYIEAVRNLREAGCEVITHIIFGLPGEDKKDMLSSVQTAIDAGTNGVKFTCLYILKGTRYQKLWEEGKIDVMGREEYFDIVESALELLPPDMVVHRITGDGPKSLLLAPMWTADKRSVVNYINRRFS